MIRVRCLTVLHDDDKETIVFDGQMSHLPRLDDLIRLPDGSVARVTEVRWLLNESSRGERVDLYMDLLAY